MSGELGGSRSGGAEPADAERPSPLPAVSLPKGGGAIRGIGEKLTPNPATGTGSFSVPLPLSPGRSGFGPELSLSYDSGSGNGPFGLGWSLGLPSITRKTDKGVPTYGEDVFLFGAEDLVPLAKEVLVDGKRVKGYRPRVESEFLRIERLTDVESGQVHWRTITRDDVTSLYGLTNESRIGDGEGRVFSWLICQSHDDRGNLIVYRYKGEDDTGVDRTQAHERHQRDRAANRYPKRILYGNRISRLAEPEPRDFLFEAVFDYGEHDRDQPTPREDGPWDLRQDPFSSHRAGFEVRTYRLCRRVLMFHHFPGEDEVGADCLVRSLDLEYREGPAVSVVQSLTQRGYRRRADGYAVAELPRIDLGYSQVRISDEVRAVEQVGPVGLDGARWVDLDGEGAAGILREREGAWQYQSNLGEGRFAAPLVIARPSLAAAGGQLVDLAGDGQLDLVAYGGPTPGFFERTPGGGWDRFTPFCSRPNLSWNDPNLRWVDLDGDGRADVLITEEAVLSWHRSRGEEGFAPAVTTRKPDDEAKGPRLVFADGAESIYLADMSGDGLTDLVRVRRAEVCYWPNLGHGRFGARVIMDGAPVLDHPEQFDQRRVRLADLDGSGPVDLLYLGRDGVRLFFNQAGNRWSSAVRLPGVPPISDPSAVSVVDLLGNGTACLVWSSRLPTERPVRYVDLMGEKPHLLVSIDNNRGAVTSLRYAPSTRFYLQDKAAGRPWSTRLPFPVHVIEQVTVHDQVSRNRYTTRYAYHDGFFDGIEREFRGFGLVEQLDTEELGVLSEQGELGDADNLDAASYVPPVLVKSWFDTGAFAPGPGLPPGLSADEEREACRARKGALLRREVFALDGSDAAQHPYVVTEASYAVVRLAPRVFFTYERERIERHLERDPGDPRVQHTLTLAVDDYGNVREQLVLAYGRARIDPELGDDPAQRLTLAVYEERDYTAAIEEAGARRAPLPCETRRYEVAGLPERQLSFEEVARELSLASRRLFAHERTLYRADDLSGPLPLGTAGLLGLPFDTFKLALTPTLVSDVYELGVDDAILGEAGYVHSEGDAQWWAPSGRVFYSPGDGDAPAVELKEARRHFFLPRRAVDPLGHFTRVTYDGYDLLPIDATDAVGNLVSAANDYRVLSPRMVTDPNQNRQAVAFDALGRVAATAKMGKLGESLGDTLTGSIRIPRWASTCSPRPARSWAGRPRASSTI